MGFLDADATGFFKISKEFPGDDQVTSNYAMVNGGYNVYNRWSNIGPSHMGWTPMAFGGRREVGVGYYASSSSMALLPPAAAAASASASASSIFNRDYARFAAALARQHNSLAMGARFYHPKPSADRGVYMDRVRKCSKCETTTTPLWRNGPRGAKSLCNACGIRYKKEERKALGIPGAQSKAKEKADQSKKAEY
ncbi:hypothetical protein ACLOJK_021235 [Asimina triloba]